MTSKEKVFAAAEKISAERNPTVSTVREAAGVSNADATRYLKEWRDERATAGTQIAATPHTVLEHAARSAGMIWAEALKLADDRHAAVKAQWERERQDKEQELAELVGDFARAVDEKDRRIASLISELEAAAQREEAAERRAAETTQAAKQMRDEISQLNAKVAAADAKTETLQQSFDALIERISPPLRDEFAGSGN